MKKGVLIMKLHSFSLFIKEAFNNIFLNRAMSFATLVVLASGIFLFGITSAITVNIFSITNKLEQDFHLTAFIDETYDNEKINEVMLSVNELSYIGEAQLVTKDEAFEKLKAMYDDAEFLESINDGTILRDSIEITLTDLSKASEVSKNLSKISGVAKVSQFEGEMETFYNLSRKIQLGTSVITVILVVLALLIMVNTINMSILARKRQIGIMKIVGATDWYIRWPFIIEGMLIGLISSVISWAGVYWVYSAALNGIGSQHKLIGILSTNEAMPLITFIIVVTGLLLGSTSSMFSIKKHLKV
ncbi:MAG: ABC transporter permease [Ruminococcaceae bacterium]|nr:ABC transporter permease [Oscillospiraceae bacterium]